MPRTRAGASHRASASDAADAWASASVLIAQHCDWIAEPLRVQSNDNLLLGFREALPPSCASVWLMGVFEPETVGVVGSLQRRLVHKATKNVQHATLHLDSHGSLPWLYQATGAFHSLCSVLWSFPGPEDPLCLPDALATPRALRCVTMHVTPALPAWRLARMLAALLRRAPALSVLRITCNPWSYAYDWSSVLARLNRSSLQVVSLTSLDHGTGAVALTQPFPIMDDLMSLEMPLLPPQPAVMPLRKDAMLANLARCRLLRTLDISGSQLDGGVTEQLVQMLASFPLLRVLDVSNSVWEPDDGVALLLTESALARVPGLRVLRASDCWLTDAVLLPVLPGMLRAVPQLRELDLRRNALADAGVEALASALVHVPRLQHLRLDENRYVDGGDLALARNMRHTPAMTQVSMPVTLVGTVIFVRHALPALQRLHSLRLTLDADGRTPVLADLTSALPALSDLVVLELTLQTRSSSKPVMLARLAAACLSGKPQLARLMLQCDVVMPYKLADAMALAITRRLNAGDAQHLSDLELHGIVSTSPISVALMGAVHQRGSRIQTVTIGCSRAEVPVLPALVAHRVYQLRTRPAYIRLSEPERVLVQAADQVPPPRLRTLFELAADIVMRQAPPRFPVPVELQAEQLARRMLPCLTCKRQTDTPRVPYHVLAGACYLQAAMCLSCYHADTAQD